MRTGRAGRQRALATSRRRSTFALLCAAVSALLVGSAVGAAPVAAAPLSVVAGILADGSAPFDASSGPGLDSAANNGVVRTDDTVQFNFQYNIDAGGASNPVIRSTLPVGLKWLLVPTECTGAGTPASGIFNVAAGDGRVLVCQLPSAASAVSSRITPIATLSNTVPNGTVLGTNFTLGDASTPTPLTSNTVTITASQEATPQYDLAKSVLNTGSTGSVVGPNGSEAGQTITYELALNTPWTSSRGGQVLANPVRFDDDFSGLPPFAALVSCTGVLNGNMVVQGCTVEGSRVHVAATLQNRIGRLSITFAVPNSVIRAGVDRVPGTADDGSYPTTNTVTGFDPDGVSGASNFGAGIEPLANNTVARPLAIGSSTVPPPTKRWQLADGTGINDSYQGLGSRVTGFVSDGANSNVIGTSETLCDIFDATAAQLDPVGTTTLPVVIVSGASDPFVVEYGRPAAPVATNAQQLAARCGNSDATWSTDPTSPTLGDAVTSSGYRDRIDRVRVRFTGPVSENVVHSFRVGLQLRSPSTHSDASGGAIINVGLKQFQGNPWQVAQARIFFSHGIPSVTKTSVPQGTGTGNHYSAGKQIEYRLQPSVTRTGAIAETLRNVQVTDILPTTTPRLTVAPASVTAPQGVRLVEYCDLCNGTDWSTAPQATVHGVRWSFGDVVALTPLPLVSLRVNTVVDTPNGTPYVNTATANSPDALSPTVVNYSVVVDAPSTVLASKSAVAPTIPVGGTAEYQLSVRNNTATNLTHLDIVDVLPSPSDGRSPGSSFGGGFSAVTLSGLPAGLTAYVTATGAAALNAADGTSDGYADPGSPGGQNYVAPGTGIWSCTLAQVGTTGCPAVGAVTAVRIAGDSPGLFPAAATFTIAVRLASVGNQRGDLYTNRFAARVDRTQLALPILSSDASVRVVAPAVALAKDVCTAATLAACIPGDDTIWSHAALIPDGGTGVFRIRATNTGNEAGSITVTDPLPTGLTFTPGSATASQGVTGAFPATWTTGELQPGATATISYRVAVERDRAAIVNTADAAMTDPFGQSATARDSASLGSVAPAITLAKTIASTDDSNGNGRADAGDVIHYSFLVTNTGPVPFATVVVDDPLVPAASCPAGALAPGASATCTGTYVVSARDADAGSVLNTATATGSPGNGDSVSSAPSSAIEQLDAPSGLSLAKTARLTDTNGSGAADAGESIAYSFVVTNTGQVTLNDVFVSDPKAGVVTCPSPALAPAATETCTATYTVSQADIDNGVVRNTATASAQPRAGGGIVSSSPSTVETAVATPAPALVLTKTASPASVTAVGQVVTYRFAVANTGNVTLGAVAIDETEFSGSGTLAPITCPTGPLPPNATVDCTTTYRVTQTDLDAGTLTNTARAIASSPAGGTVASTADTATVTLAGVSSVTLEKSATPSTITSAGVEVTYSYVVRNTGTVTLHDAAVTETAFTGRGVVPVVTCPAGPIEPGLTVTCAARYAATQGDIDAGAISNSAQATARPLSGTPPVSETSTATVTVTPAPELSLVASASFLDAADFVVGNTVTYRFEVTNTGNLTLTDPTIDERGFTGAGPLASVDCPPTPVGLAPGAQVTCSATYTFQQRDIEAGRVTNSAEATATTPSGALVRTETPSTVTVPAAQNPALSLTMSADPTAVDAVGQVVGYSFLVTNTGNVSLTNARISETAFTGTGGLAPIDCPSTSTTLLPGARITCTTSYRVTRADLDIGAFEITALARADGPDGVAVASAPSSVSVTATAPGGIALAMTARGIDSNADGRLSAGDLVAWTIAVSNTGAVALNDLAVTDGDAESATCPTTTLGPGEAIECASPPRAVTAAEALAGAATNTAFATAVRADGSRVAAAPAGATIALTADPASVASTGPGLASTGASGVAAGAAWGTGIALAGLALMHLGRRRRRTSRSR